MTFPREDSAVVRQRSRTIFLLVSVELSFAMIALEAPADEYVDVVNGRDLTGDGSQGNPWAHITYASAQVIATTTIHVAPGTYDTTPNSEGLSESFSIIIQDEISLVGDALTSSTVLDAGGTNRVIECVEVGSGTPLEGFTIRGGKASHNGGGIRCQRSSLTIRVLHVSTFRTGGAGGIWESW